MFPKNRKIEAFSVIVAVLFIKVNKSSTRHNIVANRAILLGILDLKMVGLFRKFIKTTRNLEPCITRDIGIVIHKGSGKK
jgi:hypothetical protein